MSAAWTDAAKVGISLTGVRANRAGLGELPHHGPFTHGGRSGRNKRPWTTGVGGVEKAPSSSLRSTRVTL